MALKQNRSLVIVMGLAVSMACADSLELKNGSRINGKFVGGTQCEITFQGTPTAPSRGLFERARQIDWAFIRAPIRAGSGRVHNQVDASDHYPLSFTVTQGS